MTPTVSSSPRPPVENAAFYVALLFGALSILASAINPMGLVQGPLFLLAAWGIRRERAWNAYGLAFLTAISTGMVVIMAMASPTGSSSMDSPTIRIGLLFAAAIATLLFLGGRSIERRVGRHGMAWPWLAAGAFVGGFLAMFGLYATPTGSMENTLLIGDHIAVWRSHGAAPSRGEIVTLIYPVNRKDIFVKRVVGLPGDHLRIRNKQLFVNGVEAAERYVVHKTEYVDSYRDNFPGDPNIPLYPRGREMLEKNVVNGEVVVPPGRYFVLGDVGYPLDSCPRSSQHLVGRAPSPARRPLPPLPAAGRGRPARSRGTAPPSRWREGYMSQVDTQLGDNRDSSLDSRYWGFIEQSDIIGTPKFVYLSVERTPEGLDSGFALLHLRWNRFFHPVK